MRTFLTFPENDFATNVSSVLFTLRVDWKVKYKGHIPLLFHIHVYDKHRWAQWTI